MEDEHEIDPGTHCPYPKHRGLRWDLVVQVDPGYAMWLIGGEGPDTLDDHARDVLTDLLKEAPDA
jgi:hypothetical protein